MPEVIIVASWRVMTVSSVALTRLKSVMSALERATSSPRSSMIFRPWACSCSVTASLDGPLSSPFDGTPAPSTAL